MRTLTIDENEISIAETFNELSNDQLIAYVKNYYIMLPRFFWIKDDKHEVISNDTYNALLHAQLINILKIDEDTFQKFSAEDVVFLIDEMQVISFLLEESTLTKNHFIKLKDKLIGPDDDFADLTGEEYLWAEKFYLEYKETRGVTKLNAMIACLYKTVNKKKEILPFEVKRISVIEKWIEQIEMYKKIAILLFFEGCRNEIPELYPEMFRGKKSEDSDFKEVLLQVAKDGPFGEFDKVLKTNIHLIFSELNRVSKEAIEFERKNKI